MNRFIISLLMIFLAFISSATTLPAQPKLEIEGGDSYNWGKVKPKDSPLKASIKIFNTGNDTLRISNVKPSCGCTTAPLDKNVIPPKGFSTLSITLNVPPHPGTVTKSVTISSNDKLNNGMKILLLNADVYQAISYFPSTYFSFGNAHKGEETASKMVLKNASDKDIILDSVVVDQKNFSISMKNGDKIPAHGDYEVTAKTKLDVVGPFNFRMTAKTSDPDTPELQLSGFGQVVDDTPKPPAPTAQPLVKSPKK